MPGWNIQVANIAGPHNGAVSGATAVQTKKHEQHRKPIAAAGFAGAPARFVEAAGGTKKKGPRSPCFGKSCERLAAGTDRP